MTSPILSDEIFHLAVESCPSGIIMTDADSKILLVNAEVERLFGYWREELLGQSIDILVPAPMRAMHGKHRSNFAEHPKARRLGTGRDLCGVCKDGRKIWVEVGLNPIRTGNGFIILCAITDITQRKSAEAALKRYAEREQLFIAAVESSNDAIITKALDGIITGWNAAAERLFGFTAQEAIGKSIDIIIPDEFRNEFWAILDRTAKGEKVDHYETIRIAKDGRRIDVSLSISPIKAADGKIVGAAKSVRDITAQKNDQQTLAKRSEELQRSNEDLAQFAYVASHDLQEPLRMVATYTELLSERYKGALDEKAEKYIKFVLDGAKRMQQLVKDLLAYSRVGTQDNMPTEVHSEIVVKSALDSLKVAIDEIHAEIICDKLPAVTADEGQLTQVFQNLIGNALKFHGDRSPRIHIGAEKSNGHWLFRVEDNGIGIDQEYGKLIFQMFQRLHERGHYDGSGIGLAIAKKIVERHGGRIWFESELEKGSTFYFTLPTKRAVA